MIDDFENELSTCPCGCDDDPEHCVYASFCCICGNRFFGFGYSNREYPCEECRRSNKTQAALSNAGWRVERKNGFGNHWVLLTPDGHVYSGVDNVKNKSKAWRRLIGFVPSAEVIAVNTAGLR